MEDSITDPIAEDLEEITEECDETIAELARISVVSEERHNETKGLLERCQEKLENLTLRLESLPVAMQAESPMLAQIVATLAEVKAEVSSLSATVAKLSDSKPSTPQALESSPSVEITEVSPVAGEGENPAAKTDPVPPPVKVKRYQKV